MALSGLGSCGLGWLALAEGSEHGVFTAPHGVNVRELPGSPEPPEHREGSVVAASGVSTGSAAKDSDLCCNAAADPPAGLAEISLSQCHSKPR